MIPTIVIMGFAFLGHAGYADDHQEGQELVCAAVSALALNMANSVEHFTDDQFEADEDEQSGMLPFPVYRGDQSGSSTPYEFSWCSA